MLTNADVNQCRYYYK